MPRYQALITYLVLLVGVHSDAVAQLQLPPWSEIQTLAEDAPQTTPETVWQRLQQGEGRALSRANQIIPGALGQPHWAGFGWNADGGKTVTYWLSLQSPTLDTAQLWWRHELGPWVTQPQLQQTQALSLGSGHLFAVWPIEIPAQGHTDVLVRIQGVNRVQFPLVLQTPAEFLQQQQRLCLFMGGVLAVPWVVVFYVLTVMRSFANPSLPLFLAMAVCETVGAFWISGLMNLCWPWLDRAQAGWVGSLAYGLLMVLSIHHARAFLRTDLYALKTDQWLRWGAWCWWLGLPALLAFDNAAVRMVLLYAGTLLSLCLLVLAWQSYMRYRRAYVAMYIAVWLVYLLSVVVYWLYRWYEWPLIITLGIQFVQGAVVATLLGWSGCLQVLQHRHALQLRLDRNTERSRLYAAAQHDLWQPLQSMQLYARMLMSASSAQQVHLLKGLQLASLYVDDFMHSLRYLADDKAHSLHPRQDQDCDLAGLLSEVLQEFQPFAHLRQVELRSRLVRASVRVHVPSLQRMVRNFLSNALRYGSAGGKILLGTRRQGGLLWVWCVDNGQGMTPAQAQACLKAFALPAQNDSIPQSLGLGLYSVKQLSLQMDTPLRLITSKGKGVAIGVGLRLTSPRPS